MNQQEKKDAAALAAQRIHTEQEERHEGSGDC